MASSLLPVYWKQVSFEDGQVGWLAAGFSLAAILSRLKLGPAQERWGRKPFLVIGAMLLTLCAGLYSQLQSDYPLWFLVRFIQGLGLGTYLTTMLTWVADISPPEKIGQLQGVFGVSGLIGSAAGPMLAEWVYLNYGFGAMFQALFATGILCCTLFCLLPESKKGRAPSGTRVTQRLKLKDYSAVLCLSLPFGWFVATTIVFIAPFLKSLSLSKVGVYFLGFAAASVAVRVFAGRAIDLVPTNQLVLGSSLLIAAAGLAISALIYVPSVKLLVFAAVLNGLGHGFLFPGLSSHVVRISETNQRGAGLSLFTGVFDLGLLVGSLASGYIAQAIGYSAAFALSSGLMLTALPLFVLLNPKSSDGGQRNQDSAEQPSPN